MPDMTPPAYLNDIPFDDALLERDSLISEQHENEIAQGFVASNNYPQIATQSQPFDDYLDGLAGNTVQQPTIHPINTIQSPQTNNPVPPQNHTPWFGTPPTYNTQPQINNSAPSPSSNPWFSATPSSSATPKSTYKVSPMNPPVNNAAFKDIETHYATMLGLNDDEVLQSIIAIQKSTKPARQGSWVKNFYNQNYAEPNGLPELDDITTKDAINNHKPPTAINEAIKQVDYYRTNEFYKDQSIKAVSSSIIPNVPDPDGTLLLDKIKNSFNNNPSTIRGNHSQSFLFAAQTVINEELKHNDTARQAVSSALIGELERVRNPSGKKKSTNFDLAFPQSFLGNKLATSPTGTPLPPTGLLDTPITKTHGVIDIKDKALQDALEKAYDNATPVEKLAIKTQLANEAKKLNKSDPLARLDDKTVAQTMRDTLKTVNSPLADDLTKSIEATTTIALDSPQDLTAAIVPQATPTTLTPTPAPSADSSPASSEDNTPDPSNNTGGGHNPRQFYNNQSRNRNRNPNQDQQQLDQYGNYTSATAQSNAGASTGAFITNVVGGAGKGIGIGMTHLFQGVAKGGSHVALTVSDTIGQLDEKKAARVQRKLARATQNAVSNFEDSHKIDMGLFDNLPEAMVHGVNPPANLSKNNKNFAIDLYKRRNAINLLDKSLETASPADQPLLQKELFNHLAEYTNDANRFMADNRNPDKNEAHIIEQLTKDIEKFNEEISPIAKKHKVADADPNDPFNTKDITKSFENMKDKLAQFFDKVKDFVSNIKATFTRTAGVSPASPSVASV